MPSLATLAFIVPLLLVAVPLLLGRYPGENALRAGMTRRRTRRAVRLARARGIAAA